MKLCKLVKQCSVKKRCSICKKESGRHILTHIREKYARLLIFKIRPKNNGIIGKNHFLTNINISSKILKKTYYASIASTRNKANEPLNSAIFQCNRCLFGSSKIAVFREHFAGHEKHSGSSSTSLYSFEQNESLTRERTKNHCTARYRCKDGLALLERASDPDQFELTDFALMVRDGMRRVRAAVPPPSLFCTAEKALPFALPPPPGCENASLFFHDDTSIRRQQSLFCRRIKCLPRFSTGFCCSVCLTLFLSYPDFDDHIDPDSGCSGSVPDPIEVCLNSVSNVPPELDLGYRFPKFIRSDKVGANSNSTICLACGRADFRTISLFHEHIMVECSALKIVAQNGALFDRNGCDFPPELKVELPQPKISSLLLDISLESNHSSPPKLIDQIQVNGVHNNHYHNHNHNNAINGLNDVSDNSSDFDMEL